MWKVLDLWFRQNELWFVQTLLDLLLYWFLIPDYCKCYCNSRSRNVRLYWERFFYKRGKARARMSKVLSVMVVFRLLDCLTCCTCWKETTKTHVFMHSCSTLWTYSGSVKLLLPIIPFSIVAYACTLSWANLCWNSCTDWLLTPAFDTISLPPSAVAFAVQLWASTQPISYT